MIFDVMLFALLICCAIVIDLLVGDPHWFPHPVRLIGKILVPFEKTTRKILPAKPAGILTVCIALAVVATLCGLLLFTAGLFSSLLQTVLAVLIIYTFVAIKDLLDHSNTVHRRLLADTGLAGSRRAVAQIVGRDTAELDRQGVIKACIETVAENMVDGITAPLFWAIIFSLAGGGNPLSSIAMAALGIALYKTINTMDSMFGYKNERYRQFGWAPARLDDVVNYLPARLSGMLIAAAAFLLGCDGANSWRIFRRDRLRHSSPNAGHPEAAVAGALNITLGGASSYFGKVVDKPTIGDGEGQISPQLIKKTHSLVGVASALFLLLLLVGRQVCIWIFSFQ